MTVFSHAHATARDTLILAALRVIAADDANPHADAESKYAGEKLALAARGIVRAVDALPEDQWPIGWQEQPEQAPVEACEADDDVVLAAHRVRIYSNKPGHTPDFWPAHPADCNALPYGEKCWFDALVQVERDRLVAWTGWPDAGLYLATAPADGESGIHFEPTTWEG